MCGLVQFSNLVSTRPQVGWKKRAMLNRRKEQPPMTYLTSAQAIAFASTQMADRASAWRRLWRSRGLALDRILPHCYQLPVPDSLALRESVPASVSAIGLGRRQLTAEDVEVVVDVANFVTGYVASLPAQVVAADSKALLLLFSDERSTPAPNEKS